MKSILIGASAVALLIASTPETNAQTRTIQRAPVEQQAPAPAQLDLKRAPGTGPEQMQSIFFPETTTDKMSLYGNRFGQANMFGFGVAPNTLTYKSPSLHKWYINDANPASAPAMTLSPTGLGVGTANVSHELIVEGDDAVFQLRDRTNDNSANAARIELLERAGGNYDGGAYLWWNGETNKLLIGTKNEGANTNLLVLDRGSNAVGIGTQDPGSFRLAVNGKIRAKEIVVETGWSDYVFEPDYKLMPLREVKAFIDSNGHLPDVPSASEIEANGVSLGESQATLLRKVEELTLHIIALEERLANLEGENATGAQ